MRYSCCCCWVASIVSDSVQPHRRPPTRLLCPWDSPARTLEWVAISFSNASKWKVKVKSLSRVQLLPGKSHGWRSLVGCSPWDREESDTTERLHFHFSLSCIGEGNGNPLQCSCWRIPGTGEPGGLPSLGSHRVEHDWSDLAAAAASIISSLFFLICSPGHLSFLTFWTLLYPFHLCS